MAIRLVFNPKSGWIGTAKSTPITYREMHILIMSAQGYSNKDIAEHLGIAYQTVKNNFYRLMKKLGAKTNAQALLLAMQSGMITIEHISPVKPAQLQAPTDKEGLPRGSRMIPQPKSRTLSLIATKRERQLRLSDTFPGVLS